MFDFLKLENRKLQRRNLVNFIIKILNKTNISNKIWAFIIKAWHFTFPWYLFIFVFIPGNYNFCLFCYLFLVFFLFLYIYLHGCFISHIEYKLYDKKFVNIIDPYLALFGFPFNNETRFYGTFAVAFAYFLVVSIVLYFRFFKKIE